MTASYSSLDSGALEVSLAPLRGARRWLVAFSGGLDSTVLLHLLHGQRAGTHTPPLSAVHINHQLQTASAGWQRQVAAYCAGLGVPLETLPVTVQEAGYGPEAAARDARYAALESVLGPGDVMFFAHHQDDQVETLLLRWLRGAGLRGLQGMPAERSLGLGRLARPLLDLPRSALEAYAVAHALVWIDDPSNADVAFDRNYLRHSILPLFAQRWPGYRASVARSARQLAAAESVLDALLPVPRPLATVLGDPGLALDDLFALSDAGAAMQLRGWLVRQARPLPPVTALTEFLRQLQHAGGTPSLVWQGQCLRRFGNGVFLLPPVVASAQDVVTLAPGHTLRLTDGSRLILEPAGQRPGILLHPGEVLTVHGRQGGERCRLPGRPGSRRLKTLLQDAAIPPWWRERIPLLYLDDALIAVADLFLCAGPRLAPEGGADAWQLRWTQNTVAPAD